MKRFDKDKGIVVKDGKVIATYPRLGGLYVAESEATDKDGDPGNDADFARQGVRK